MSGFRKAFCALGLFALSHALIGPLFAGTIQGRVTNNEGNPVSEVTVYAYRMTDPWSWSYETGVNPDGDGNYILSELPAGTYRIQFNAWSGTYVPVVYPSYFGWNLNGGTDLILGDTDVLTGIDVQLVPASRIEGRVTDNNGLPIEGIQASAYRWTGNYWNQVSSGNTDPDGYYSIGGLGADTYRVDFRDWNGEYVGESYDDIPGYAYNGGTEIPVGSGVVISNINAVLASASRIEGRVTNLAAGPLENIYVSASRWNGSWWQQEASDYSDSDGYYSLGGLPAGSYLISFNDWNNYQYAPLVYSNYHNSDYWNGGPYDLVSVGSGVTVSEINAVMLEYASLYGTVYRADGVTPLANCLVVLRDYNAGYYRDHTYTDESGNYVFERVAPGSFAVHAGPSADQYYLGQWLGGVMLIPTGWWQDWFYSDTPTPEGVNEVVVYGADIDGLDMVLPAAGKISGAVMGSGSLPLGDVLVTAFTGTNYVYFDSYTAADGTYEIRGLFPGDYQIKVEAAAFKDEWWNNVHHRDGASTINVNIGDHYELNFDLEPGQSPAYFKIESDPPGALIFLNFYPTTNRTPVLLEMGEAGWWDDAGNPLAPHYVSVEGPDGILMHVYDDNPVEAETVTIVFDLTATNLSTGALSIQTDPNGFEVYVNRLDVPVGPSPVVVENLEAASSTHMIFVKADGHMVPRPVMAYNVYAGQTNEIVIPVSSRVDTNRMMASVRSTPPGAQVFVNYMETTNVTDVVVDWLDPATHGGMGWSSASHTIMVKRPGFKQTSPRYVPEVSGVMHQLVINMRLDEVEEARDEDANGLPDQIEEIYGLTGLPPGLGGADGDADGDGVSNIDEIRAGTNPMDANDTFETTSVPMPLGQEMSFTFKSIPGRSYVVMCSVDLMRQEWTYASGIVTATEDETTVNITMPEGVECRFFRVIVLAP